MLQPHSVSAKDFAGSSREPRKSDLNAKPTLKRLHVCDGLPVMVLSDACYLSKLTPEERVKHGECAHESGGYFLMAQGKTGTVAERFLEMQDYRAANVISIHAANEKKTKVRCHFRKRAQNVCLLVCVLLVFSRPHFATLFLKAFRRRGRRMPRLFRGRCIGEAPRCHC